MERDRHRFRGDDQVYGSGKWSAAFDGPVLQNSWANLLPLAIQYKVAILDVKVQISNSWSKIRDLADLRIRAPGRRLPGREPRSAAHDAGDRVPVACAPRLSVEGPSGLEQGRNRRVPARPGRWLRAGPAARRADRAGRDQRGRSPEADRSLSVGAGRASETAL